MNRAEIARTVNEWADDLNSRGIPAGIARALALLVVEDGRQIERLERQLAALRGPGPCPVCGGSLKQPATGRRRRYCSDRCRRRAHRDETGTNGRMIAS